jgi:hypothetical protein
MNLNLYTWNNTAINDGTVLRSSFPRGTKTNLTANPVTVNRAGDFPFLSGTVLAPHTLVIDVDILPGQDLNAKRELIKQYFDITDQTRHNLVARDAADSNREWYVTGYPVRITEQNSPVVFSVVFFKTPALAVSDLTALPTGTLLTCFAADFAAATASVGTAGLPCSTR